MAVGPEFFSVQTPPAAVSNMVSGGGGGGFFPYQGIIGGGGVVYISGDDSNIVFTPVASGEGKGKIKVDVYYK